MTHLKRQNLISSTQVRGYNTQFLLYPLGLPGVYFNEVDVVDAVGVVAVDVVSAAA